MAGGLKPQNGKGGWIPAEEQAHFFFAGTAVYMSGAQKG